MTNTQLNLHHNQFICKKFRDFFKSAVSNEQEKLVKICADSGLNEKDTKLLSYFYSQRDFVVISKYFNIFEWEIINLVYDDCSHTFTNYELFLVFQSNPFYLYCLPFQTVLNLIHLYDEIYKHIHLFMGNYMIFNSYLKDLQRDTENLQDYIKNLRKNNVLEFKNMAQHFHLSPFSNLGLKSDAEISDHMEKMSKIISKMLTNFKSDIITHERYMTKYMIELIKDRLV